MCVCIYKKNVKPSDFVNYTQNPKPQISTQATLSF